jgi:hypothetical protein
MIDELAEASAPVSFALDVGVVGVDSKTTLVEMNEGFALGRYALDPAVYFNCIAARWAELMAPLL